MDKTFETMTLELNGLLSAFERDNLSVDSLAQKLDEAYSLLELMSARLTETEAKIERIIQSRTTSSASTAPRDETEG